MLVSNANCLAEVCVNSMLI